MVNLAEIWMMPEKKLLKLIKKISDYKKLYKDFLIDIKETRYILRDEINYPRIFYSWIIKDQLTNIERCIMPTHELKFIHNLLYNFNTLNNKFNEFMIIDMYELLLHSKDFVKLFFININEFTDELSFYLRLGELNWLNPNIERYYIKKEDNPYIQYVSTIKEYIKMCKSYDIFIEKFNNDKANNIIESDKKTIYEYGILEPIVKYDIEILLDKLSFYNQNIYLYFIGHFDISCDEISGVIKSLNSVFANMLVGKKIISFKGDIIKIIKLTMEHFNVKLNEVIDILSYLTVKLEDLNEIFKYIEFQFQFYDKFNVAYSKTGNIIGSFGEFSDINNSNYSKNIILSNLYQVINKITEQENNIFVVENSMEYFDSILIPLRLILEEKNVDETLEIVKMFNSNTLLEYFTHDLEYFLECNEYDKTGVIKSIYPDINIKSRFLDNKTKYYKYLKRICYVIDEELMESILPKIFQMSFCDNLETVLFQLHILVSNNDTNILNMNFDMFENLFYILCIYNSIVPHSFFEIQELPVDLIEYEFSPRSDIFSHIAKIVLFCKNYSDLDQHTLLTIKLYLLVEKTDDDFYEIIKKYTTDINIQNAYAVGVNVHDGVRDNRTTHCIDVLFKTYNLSKEEIIEYFDLFWEYRLKLTEVKRIALLRVLGVDDQLNTVRTGNNDYGGLLTADILIGNKMINAKTFIAYFWFFACNFKEESCSEDPQCIENDRENMRFSIMSGLIDALQDDRPANLRRTEQDNGKNHVVCNPGKLQRLVTSSLQGRLKDETGMFVYVDKEANISEKIVEEEVVVRRDVVFNTNYNDIYGYIRETMLYCSLNKITCNRLFTEIFVCLDNLWDKQIYLNWGSAVYVVVMMAVANEGLIINPDLSLASTYEDMFEIKDYIDNFITNEIRLFEEANPELLEAREQRRLLRERNEFKRLEFSERQQMRSEDR